LLETVEVDTLSVEAEPGRTCNLELFVVHSKAGVRAYENCKHNALHKVHSKAGVTRTVNPTHHTKSTPRPASEHMRTVNPTHLTDHRPLHERRD